MASFTPDYLAYGPYLVGTLSDPIGPVSVILSPIPVILAPGSVGVIGFAPGNRQNSLAFGFGGGATYRLTQHFSLRADLRDYVTKAGLGGASGKNHGSFHAGLVFRF
jgi:hypothetical protein